LLIVVVVTAISLIGVFLLSQQTPEKVPNINFMTGTDNSGNLYLYHNGGDTLKKGEFAVLIDGHLTPYEISEDTWSLGKSLIFKNVPPGTHSVSIIYNGTSGAGSAVLRTGSSSSSVFAGTINPDVLPGSVPSSGGGGGSPGADYIFNDAYNISNSTYFIPAIQQNLTGKSISLWRARYDALDSSLNTFALYGLSCGSSTKLTCTAVCYCNNDETFVYSFTVNDNTNTNEISYGTTNSPTLIPLQKDDVVYITLDKKLTYFSTNGIAPSIWELNGGPLNLTIVRGGAIFGGQHTNTWIQHTLVGNYTNLKSNLIIGVDGGGGTGYDTTLVVNGTTRINGLNAQDIVMTNVRPTPVGLYVIFMGVGSANNQPNFYFAGQADRITFNAANQIFP
ncbi:MAG: hypothetical protein CVV34_00435, partial [Methanomicrobiales archaeon HGW-Methanomicrobiales-5]